MQNDVVLGMRIGGLAIGSGRRPQLLVIAEMSSLR